MTATAQRPVRRTQRPTTNVIFTSEQRDLLARAAAANGNASVAAILRTLVDRYGHRLIPTD